MESYNLPVGLREWFVKRLIKQLEDEQAAQAQAYGSTGNSQILSTHNQPQVPPQFQAIGRKDGKE